MESSTGLDSYADKNNFLAVYPDAVGGDAKHTWALGCYQCTWADVVGVDDYQFARDLVQNLKSRYKIDASKIYVAGVSLGGSFAYDFACRSSEIVAGTAVVASLPSPEELTACSISKPMSALIMNGDADPNIPWTGGGDYHYLGAEAATGKWVSWDGCKTDPTVSQLPDTQNDGKTVELRDYPACAGGRIVQLFRIKGGGHEWPNGDLNASQRIAMTFFGP